MASAVRVPANCSTVTFTVSGVIAAVAGVISGMTANELTAMCRPYRRNAYLISTNPTTGATDIKLPAGLFTSITINGNAYVPNASGVISAVPAADATTFLGNTFEMPFQIVTGA